jgi:hypothetical protein
MPMADLKNGSFRTDSAASKSLFALRDQPEIGPDQLDVRNTVALGHGASGSGGRRVR